ADADTIRNGSPRRAPARAPRRARTSRPVVGRLLESEDLVSLLDDATAGMGGLATLSGEAGIGKTTLARQLSTLAEQRGIPALGGAAPGPEPRRPDGRGLRWGRAVAARREGPEVFEALGAMGAWLDTIVPDLELGDGREPSLPPSHISADEGRFHLYDA